jgi:hypothetical protein
MVGLTWSNRIDEYLDRGRKIGGNMKVKTLSKLLEDYDPSDSVKINKDNELLIGGRGGFLIKLPTSFKRKSKVESEKGLWGPGKHCCYEKGII